MCRQLRLRLVSESLPVRPFPAPSPPGPSRVRVRVCADAQSQSVRVIEHLGSTVERSRVPPPTPTPIPTPTPFARSAPSLGDRPPHPLPPGCRRRRRPQGVLDALRGLEEGRRRALALPRVPLRGLQLVTPAAAAAPARPPPPPCRSILIRPAMPTRRLPGAPGRRVEAVHRNCDWESSSRVDIAAARGGQRRGRTRRVRMGGGPRVGGVGSDWGKGLGDGLD